MFSPFIKKLIEQFTKFPTIGPRTASRFVFYLLKAPKEEVKQLSKTIFELQEKIKTCFFCFNSFEPVSTFASTKVPVVSDNVCQICSNPTRDRTLLCVIEKEIDLIALEKTKKYKGLYFVLGGTITGSTQEALKKIRTQELIKRIKDPVNFHISKANFKEIIIAINPTIEGIATAMYLERMIKPLNKKITRLARGLPSGSELEYADEETLSSALDNRK